MTNHSQKRRGRGHVTHFSISIPAIIPGTTKATVAKFRMQVEYIKWDDRLHLIRRGQGNVTQSHLWNWWS